MKVVDQIPIAAIQPDPDQPRKVFGQDELAELARSIEQNGLLQPISVRSDGNGGYLIIAGERRYRAVCSLGRENIDALVFDGIAEDRARELQLIENINRSDLTPIEEAKAYQCFIEKGYTVAQVAEIVGKDRGVITWLMKVLNARPDIQHLVGKGQLPVTVGVALGKLSYNGQGKALRIMTENKMDVQACCLLCERIWAEENSVDMFPEAKLSAQEQKARKAVKSAFERACKALEEVSQIEERNPGVVGAAMATEIEVMTTKVDELMRGLKELRKGLMRKKVALLQESIHEQKEANLQKGKHIAAMEVSPRPSEQ